MFVVLRSSVFFKVVQFNFEHNYHKLNQQPLVFISEKLLDDCFIPFSVQKHGYGNSACSFVVWLFLLVVVVSHSFVTGLCTPWFYTVPSTLVSRFERWCFRFRKGALSNLKNALFCQTMFAILRSWKPCLWGTQPVGGFDPMKEAPPSLGRWASWSGLGEKHNRTCHRVFPYSSYVSNFTVLSYFLFNLGLSSFLKECG